MKTDKLDSAGIHLLMDAYVLDAEVFQPARLTTLFENLAGIADPLKSTSYGDADQGSVGLMQIGPATHLAIHAWPSEQCFSFAGYFERSADAVLAITVLKTMLGVRSDHTKLVPTSKPHQPEGQLELPFMS